MIEALSLIALWCSVPTEAGTLLTRNSMERIDICRAELVACVDKIFQKPWMRSVINPTPMDESAVWDCVSAKRITK